MPNFRIPNIVKHCTIAIYRKGKVVGANKRDTFIQCFKIARHSLQQQGFIELGSESDLTAAIGLTPKGRGREAYHKREGRSKTLLFDILYDQADLDGSRARKERKAQEAAAAAKAAEQDAAAKAKKKAPAKKPVNTPKPPKSPSKRERF